MAESPVLFNPLPIAVSAFSSLVVEIALTRLFSVVLFYHFAFMAISVALLGHGAGAVYAYVRKEWLAQYDTRQLLACLSALNAVIVLVVLEIILHVPVSLGLTMANLISVILVYLVATAPFFIVGMGMAVVLSRQPKRVPVLYGADLVGGALACVAVVPLLNLLGAPNVVLVACLSSAVAASLWAQSPCRRVAGVALASVFFGLICLNHSGRLIDIVYAKGILRKDQAVEFAGWNALGRAEVIQYPKGKAILIDADAYTPIMSVPPKDWQDGAIRKKLMSQSPAAANVLRPQGKYAIIGPGGGIDVLRALVGGSSSVTAIEINPLVANSIMRGRYAGYSHNLFRRPEVQIEVGDGRSLIRNSTNVYDVVQMTLVDTWASTAAGAFVLSENGLYTVEAFVDYFQHLKPDGLVAVTR